MRSLYKIKILKSASEITGNYKQLLRFLNYRDSIIVYPAMSEFSYVQVVGTLEDIAEEIKDRKVDYEVEMDVKAKDIDIDSLEKKSEITFDTDKFKEALSNVVKEGWIQEYNNFAKVAIYRGGPTHGDVLKGKVDEDDIIAMTNNKNIRNNK